MTEDADTIFEKHSLKKELPSNTLYNLLTQYYRGAHQGEFRNIEDFFSKTKPNLPITVEEINLIMEEMHTTKRLIPETINLIKELKTNYKIALLTNFTSDLERFLKDVFGIFDLFDVVVNSYDIKFKKPHPKAFLYTLEKLNLEPQEVIFIDDKKENIEGSENIGIKGILFENYKQLKSDLDKIIFKI